MEEIQEQNQERNPAPTPAPGFRFYPTEEEIISFYLRNQLDGKVPEKHRVIPVFNIYDVEPWNLPKFAGELCKSDSEQWFFFVPRQEREAKGGRPSRTTGSGYWKATGSPVHVYSSDSRVIGLKKTMVFYKGRAPTGTKTKWKMNEYRAIEKAENPSPTSIVATLRYEFSLCRVYVVSGTFRAFDRRPMEVTAGAGHHQKNAVLTRFSDQKLKQVMTMTMTMTSSAETSCSVPGMDCRTELYCGGSSSNGEMMDDEEQQLQESLWEWEQFNWH